jgi:hypothetical protein
MLNRCISDLERQLTLTQIGDGGRLVVPAAEPVPVDPWSIPGTSCSEVGHWLYCSCGDSCRDTSRDYRHFLDDHTACGEAGRSP